MRPRRLFVLVLLALALAAGGLPAQAASGYDLVDACLDNGGSPSMCRGLWQLLRIPGGLCRDLADDDPSCTSIDGVSISEALVDANEKSWLSQALRMQRRLDDTHPLHDELWTHTHNSFNADAYALQALGGIDRNQIYSIRDQLRMGVRGIEVDLHFAPDLLAGGADTVQVCHGGLPFPFDNHIGCEVGSMAFSDIAFEIRGWMDDNPDEVVLLDLENSLESDVGAHNEVAQLIEDVFGDVLYRPATACGALPMDTSRKAIRDSGARIMLTGRCGPGGWGALVHERGPRWEETGIGDGDDFPAYPCTDERTSNNYAANFTRRYADETGLSAGAQAGGDVTPTDALNMTRCGVNLLGWDNLVAFDERMGNLVWSWRSGEPVSIDDSACASLGPDGLFHVKDCSVTKETIKIRRRHRKPRYEVVERAIEQQFACYDGSAWSITTAPGRFTAGQSTCASEGRGSFAVPWSGYEMERLKTAKGDAIELWVNYRAADWR